VGNWNEWPLVLFVFVFKSVAATNLSVTLLCDIVWYGIYHIWHNMIWCHIISLSSKALYKSTWAYLYLYSAVNVYRSTVCCGKLYGLFCPRPVGGGALSGDRRPLSVRLSVCLMSRTSALTRKPKGLGRRNFAQEYPRSHATPTPTSRSKGQKSRSRGGGILWRPPSRTACYCCCCCILPLSSARMQGMIAAENTKHINVFISTSPCNFSLNDFLFSRWNRRLLRAFIAFRYRLVIKRHLPSKCQQ